MSITTRDRKTDKLLRWVNAAALAWLLLGFANTFWQIVAYGVQPLQKRCASSLCLPEPGEAFPGESFSRSWDIAAFACGQQPADPAPPPATKDEPEVEQPAEEQGEELFDGKSLDGWKETEFGGQGTVEVVDGQIRLGAGQDLTGITWDGDEFPTTNYELELEAMRVDGVDFFCGLTFPVGEQPCSLIVGGWGGTVVGLSSIDRFDASMNETTKFMSFDRGKWYKIRLRVTPEKIAAWIEDEQVVDFEIGDHKISIRVEVQASKPLGVASWQTSAALRNIRLRRLDEGDGAKPGAEGATPRE